MVEQKAHPDAAVVLRGPSRPRARQEPFAVKRPVNLHDRHTGNAELMDADFMMRSGEGWEGIA